MAEIKLSYEEVKFWLEEAKSCQERQDKELRDRNCYPWLINYYEGEQYTDDFARNRANARKMSFINEYFPNTNALIAEIMYQNPDITAEASKPTMNNQGEIIDEEGNADIMKSALTYGFNKLDALTENRLALFDMIMAGFCAVEVNHINIPETETVPRPGQEPKDVNIIGKIGNAIKSAFSKDKVEEEIEKTIPAVEIAYSTPDETYIRRWDPAHILLDYRADRVKDMRYIIKKIFMSYAEFNVRYPQFKDKVQAGTPLPFSVHEDEKHKKSVMLYEFQVKQRGGKYVNFILSPNMPLSEIDYFERPYTTNGFNIKIGTLHEYGKLYPISIAKINKYIQDDINNYTTFMMEVAERNIPKIGYDKNKCKEDGVQGLRSNKVNDLVPVDGIPGQHIQPIPATNVSIENKQLLEVFSKQKEKLWTISESRLQQSSDAKFATDLQIQNAGFQSTQSDIQEGLRKLIKSELDTLKDIIVQFWDDPMFFKITGNNKPSWYVPQVVDNPMKPGSKMVANALTEILTMDYEVNIDISSSLKPNKDRKKQEDVKFLELLISPPMQMYIQSTGNTLDIEAVKQAMKEWGWNPNTYIKPINPPNQGNMGQPMLGQEQGQGEAVMPQNQPIPGGMPQPQGQPAPKESAPAQAPVRLSLSLSLTPADLLNHSVVQLLKDGGIELPMPPSDMIPHQLAVAHKKSVDALQPQMQPQGVGNG